MSATANYTEIETLLARRAPFIGSSSRAYVSPKKISQGQLNDREYEDLREAHGRGAVTYVVCSYGTPIAWVADEHPYVVEQHFSQTISRIQRLCREYL
jgi:hypothetical protein